MTPPVAPKTVTVSGATGYIGQALCAALLARGHRVRAAVREASRSKAPAGVEVAVVDPFDSTALAASLVGSDVLVHLIGTPHPNPSKAAEFRAVDLASALAAVDAVASSRLPHFVYVSVAHPAPVMKPYVDARIAAEAAIEAAAIPATVVRPWYVLGPGHWWPLVLVPLYALARLVPGLRDGALRLGLCSRADLVATLVDAVEAGPASATRVIDVPGIRRLGSAQQRLGGQGHPLA